VNRTTSRKMLTATLAAIALLTAACGSDDSSDAADSDTTEAAQASDTTEAGQASDTTDTTEAGDGGNSGGDLVQQAVDKAVAEAATDGVDLDRDCVAEVASKLSDADLQSIADAPAGEDVALSAEGEAVAVGLLTCAPREQLVDQMVSSLAGQEGVDQQCVRDIFEAMSDDDLKAMAMSGGDSASQQFQDLMSQMMACMTVTS
jgi:hypothetical protein